MQIRAKYNMKSVEKLEMQQSCQDEVNHRDSERHRVSQRELATKTQRL